MRKLFILATLFLCSFSITNTARAQNLNWCGTYVEKNNHGFIVIPLGDIKDGSKNCTLQSYKDGASNASYITVLLDFNNRSKLNNWRKFNSHVIEIRGRMNRRNQITNARLVRDFGA